MSPRAPVSIPRRWRVWALAPALLAAAAAAGGCQAIPVLFAPDPIEEAQFKLTPDPVLLLVENPPDSNFDPMIRYNLIRNLTREFKARKVNDKIVPDEQLRRLQATRPTSAEWTEARLGKAFHAEQVVHIQLEPYTATAEMLDPTARTRIAAYVRVIDVRKEEQVWPIERAGQKVIFDAKMNEIQTDSTDALRKKLAAGLADHIVKLFYKHKVTDIESFQRDTGAEEGLNP